ncbi:MAG: hypothetical protein AAB382_01230, partial [Chloroflexota bacterium]
QWRSLGAIALKSDAAASITVEIGGQNADHTAVRERVRLLPNTRTVGAHDYYSVLYLSAPRMPRGIIGLHSLALNETHIVEPTDWANIWVYGQRVYLCGWLNKHDFRQCSRRLPANSPVKQYRCTATANRAAPMSELRPMTELAEIARKYQR